jgi:hypothetical protein
VSFFGDTIVVVVVVVVVVRRMNFLRRTTTLMMVADADHQGFDAFEYTCLSEESRGRRKADS